MPPPPPRPGYLCADGNAPAVSVCRPPPPRPGYLYDTPLQRGMGLLLARPLASAWHTLCTPIYSRVAAITQAMIGHDVEEDFDVDEFLEGAEGAVEGVMAAFAARDYDALQGMASGAVHRRGTCQDGMAGPPPFAAPPCMLQLAWPYASRSACMHARRCGTLSLRGPQPLSPQPTACSPQTAAHVRPCTVGYGQRLACACSCALRACTCCLWLPLRASDL